MKKIYSILALGALLALSSCSKDDISTYSEQEAGVRFLATKLSKAEDELGGSAYSPSDQILYENYSFIDNPMDDSYEYDIPVALIGMTSKRLTVRWAARFSKPLQRQRALTRL